MSTNPGGGAKKPSGIPTGIPSRLQPPTSVRKSNIPTSPASSGQQSVSASSSDTHIVSSSVDESPKLATSSSQKSLNASKIHPPHAVSSASSTSIGQTTTTPAAGTTSLVSSTSDIQHSSSSTSVVGNEVEALRNTIKDLNEKLETLKLKRAEDREKLREADKLKLQMQQLQEFKTKAQEAISSLNKELQQSKQEASSYKEQFENYKEEMSSHEQRLEEMTVDKELAEAKLEELQDEITKLTEKNEEIKLELDVLKGEIEINGVSGAASSFQNKQLEKECETLKAALIKLRDMSLQDKTEINKHKKQGEELSAKVTKLGKENETLKSENNVYLTQINELKDQVTATLGSVEMIEQLTQQNLDLETKIEELKETISDLEAINEVNDQLQESAREEEKELRRSLDISETRIRDAEKQIELLKYNLADQEKTILKFRERVKQLQDENDLLKRKLKTEIEEKQEMTNMQGQGTQMGFNFKQKFLETQNMAIQIENELNKIELSSYKKYSSNLLSFFPDNFTKQSGENECILSLLFFKRLASKCDFILNHFKEKINNLEAETNSSSDEASKTNGQMEFFHNLSMYASILKLLCNKFDYVLNNCDVKVFNNIGSMYYDFNQNEKTFDGLFELMQKDQLDESYSFENLEKTLNHFETIYKNHLTNEKFDNLTFLDDLLNYSTVTSDAISIVLKRLNKLIETKDDSAEIILLFKEISCKNDENKQSLKKLQRGLSKDEKLENKIALNISNEILAELDQSLNNFFLIIRTLKELYNLISNYKILSSNEYGEIPSSKTIEELAYQACDKVYLKDDNGPYENLRNSLKQINKSITQLCSSIEHGEFETKLTDEEFKIRKYQINCPILKCSQDYKNTLIEAENIKYKLEAKEDEIKELKKNLKLKVDELSEQKLRISLIEKKGETNLKEIEEKSKQLSKTIEDLKAELLKKEKEHSDTAEALQQELDTLQNEKRDLKEKLKNSEKRNIIAGLVNRQVSESPSMSSQVSSSSSHVNASSDTYALIYELNLVKNVNRTLQKNLMETNRYYVRSMMDKLTPLSDNVLKSTSDESTPGKEITSLSKMSDSIMTDIYDMLVNSKVVDLREAGRNKYKSEQQKNNISLSMIRNKIANLNSKLTEIQRTNGSVLKQTDDDQKKRKLVAEIRIPRKATTTSPSTIDLNLNLDEIKEIIRKI